MQIEKELLLLALKTEEAIPSRARYRGCCQELEKARKYILSSSLQRECGPLTP